MWYNSLEGSFSLFFLFKGIHVPMEFHNRVVVFQTLHGGQRYTRLCPYLVQCATLYPFLLSQLLCLPCYHIIAPPPPFVPPSYMLPPLPSPLPLTSQFTPVPATAYPPMPPSSSPLPTIGPELIVSQYTLRPYSTFSKCRSPLSQTPPPLSPPPLSPLPPRCTTTFRTASTMISSPSVAFPPGPGTPPVLVPCGG